MAYFTLDSIVGCHSPASGITTGFEIKYNEEIINSYYKKNIKRSSNNEFLEEFVVVVVFENHTQIFKFYTESDRNDFYDGLPS